MGTVEEAVAWLIDKRPFLREAVTASVATTAVKVVPALTASQPTPGRRRLSKGFADTSPVKHCHGPSRRPVPAACAFEGVPLLSSALAEPPGGCRTRGGVFGLSAS